MFELVGKIIGDGAHWAYTLDQAVKDAEHATTEIGSKSAAMMSAMNVVAQAIGTAIRKVGQELIDLANESLDAWMETEDTLVSLQSVIESNGGDVKLLTTDYQEFASAMQRVTTMGDDTVLSILQTAEAFGLTGDAAKKAAQDAISIAAINNSNAESMIRITAKMAEGNIQGAMAFGRMIPQLRGVKNELEFLEKYQRLVSGGWLTAQREAETTSGELAQLENDWGDVNEIIGEFLADFLVPAVQGLKELVLWLGESAEAARYFFAGFTLGLSELAIRGAQGWRMLFNLIDQARGGVPPIELDIDLNAANLDQFGKDVADAIIGNMATGVGGFMNRLPPGFQASGVGGELGMASSNPFHGAIGRGLQTLGNARPIAFPLEDPLADVLGPKRGGPGFDLRFFGDSPLRGSGNRLTPPTEGGLVDALSILRRQPTIANRMGLGGAFGGLGDVFAPEEEEDQTTRLGNFRSNLQEEERQFLAMQAGRRGGPEEQTAQGVQRLVDVNEEILAIQRDARNNGGQLMAANL